MKLSYTIDMALSSKAAQLVAVSMFLAINAGCVSAVVGAAAGRSAGVSSQQASVSESKRDAKCRKEHPEWGETDCTRISRGLIWVGMSDAQLVAALGEPKKRECEQSTEKWRYHGRVVVVTGGVVTRWY